MGEGRKRFDVSGRQARRIVRDLGSAASTQATRLDLLEIIERALMRYEALIEHLAQIADETSDPTSAIHAMQRPVTPDGERDDLASGPWGCYRAGLSDIGHELEARTTALRAVEVLDRHGVPFEARAELLAVLSVPAAAHEVPDRPRLAR